LNTLGLFVTMAAAAEPAVLGDPGTTMVVAILLFIVGLGLMCAEMMMPGVVFGLTGLACAIAAVLVAFFKLPGSHLGVVLTIILVCFVPLWVFLWAKVLGKVLAVTSTEGGFVGAKEDLKSLLSEEGVTLTRLRPSGAAQFGDKKVDVVADGEIIDQGVRVRVVEVSGNRVVVRTVRV